MKVALSVNVTRSQLAFLWFYTRNVNVTHVILLQSIVVNRTTVFLMVVYGGISHVKVVVTGKNLEMIRVKVSIIAMNEHFNFHTDISFTVR